ncbi:hypothetical protein IAT38_005369 [Cryptococcus sp. DSM 104549]
MVPTDIPTAAATPSLPALSISPPATPRLMPRFSTLARWGAPRTPKRSRSEDDDAYSATGGGLESLRRYTSNDEVDMDGGWRLADADTGAGSSSSSVLPVPAPRPVIRARSSKKTSRPKREGISASSSAPDISLSSRSSPPPEPAAKRQRSGSTSSTSSLTGILVADKDATPSSPISEAAISGEIIAPVPSRPAKPLPPWSYTPSPLATAPVMSLDEPSPSSLPLLRHISPASPLPPTLAPDAPPPLPLTPEGRDVDVVGAAAQLTKARAFWRDVEDLGAELGNVLRLGLGRGMNRGKGGERRPSRLRSTLSVEDEGAGGGKERERERGERERSEDVMEED